MGALKLTTASSGSVILNPANTASDVTITVPAVTGTMLTNKTAGTVLQVVNTTTTSDTSTSSTSYTNFSFLNTSITPTSSSSKILVIAQIMPFTGANANMQFTLYRNSTNLGPATGFAYVYGSSTVNIACPTVMTYLDSPATTSSTTYGVYGKTSTGTFYFNNGNCQLSMTLLEIAA
jgi:hypothetical protein